VQGTIPGEKQNKEERTGIDRDFGNSMRANKHAFHFTVF